MYKYRKLDKYDAPCLRNLYFQEEDIHMNFRQSQHYEARVRKIYGEMLMRGSYIYGCFDTETKKLVASITVNKCLDCYPNYTDSPYVHLETFIVHKEYQNKGIGTQLLKHVLDVIKEEGCTYVIMQSNNPTIQHIANKAGLTNSLSDMRIDFVEAISTNN
jgi:GNAT superfamily N-acetyltransferase